MPGPSHADEVSPAVRPRLLVADRTAAERVAIELIRNHLLAHPAQDLLLAGAIEFAGLRQFLRDAGTAFGVSVRNAPGRPGLEIVGSASAESAAATDALVMPGATVSTVARRCQTSMVIAEPAGTVIVVPGTARQRDGTHALTAEAFGRLRRAEDLARRSTVRAVILSGWNGSAARGMSEAEQLLRAWAGPEIPVILDEAARCTAENALCAAAIIEALGGVHDVRVVASWGNALRLRLAFHAALRTQRLRTRLSIVWGIRHGASWRPGLLGLFLLRRHLLAGRTMLDCTLKSPVP